MFHKIADQLKRPTGLWGKVISRFLKRMNSNIYDQVIIDVDAQEGDQIFEIGYGHGDGVNRILRNVNCHVSGIDFSKVMYDDSVKLNKKYVEEGKVELFYGDFLEFDMNQNGYDKVFCVNVIYFWESLELPFTKVKSSLSKNGMFFIYMDSLEEITKSKFTNEVTFNSYTVTSVMEQLTSIGFNCSYYDYARGHIIKAHIG